MKSVDKQLQELAEKELVMILENAESALSSITHEADISVESIGKLLSGVKMQSEKRAVIKHLRERKVKELLDAL